jgi:acetone carboxylase gamma subunit
VRTYTSPTLQIRTLPEGNRICCARCGYALAHPGLAWKQATIVREIPTDELSGEVVTGEPAETILRQFICRGCGSLLDSETALPGDPFLEDTLIV